MADDTQQSGTADDDVDAVGRAAERAVERQFRRFERLARRYGRIARVLAVVIGVVIVLIGIALLVLPGPGWGLIFLGLAATAVGVPRLRPPLLSAVRVISREAERIRRSPTLIGLVSVFAVAVVAFGGWWYFLR